MNKQHEAFLQIIIDNKDKIEEVAENIFGEEKIEIK